MNRLRSGIKGNVSVLLFWLMDISMIVSLQNACFIPFGCWCVSQSRMCNCVLCFAFVNTEVKFDVRLSINISIHIFVCVVVNSCFLVSKSAKMYVCAQCESYTITIWYSVILVITFRSYHLYGSGMYCYSFILAFFALKWRICVD